MADANNTFSATGSVILDIDSDNDSLTQSMRVRKNSATVVFQVNEDGTVTVTGNIVRSAGQVLHNDSGANVNILLLKSGTGAGSDRLVFSYDGTDAKMVGDFGVKIVADDNLKLVFNADDTGTEYLEIRKGSAATLLTNVDANGIWAYYDPGAALAQASLDPLNANDDCVIELGPPTGTRGKLVLRADTLDDVENDPRAGLLVMYNKSGTAYYLWVDVNGDLEIDTVDPGTTGDLSGTVVGTQT